MDKVSDNIQFCSSVMAVVAVAATNITLACTVFLKELISPI